MKQLNFNLSGLIFTSIHIIKTKQCRNFQICTFEALMCCSYLKFNAIKQINLTLKSETNEIMIILKLVAISICKIKYCNQMEIN